MLRELMNGSFCTREQVESALQTACISVVPLVKADKGPRLSSLKPMLSFDRGLGADLNNQRTIPRDPDVFWAVLNSPFSRFAEAMRSIKLAIDLNSGQAPTRSSASPRRFLMKESRRLQLVVALLMAQAGARVILVDCDLRNPSLSRRLAPNADHGILDVIVRKDDFGGCGMDGSIYQPNVLARRDENSRRSFQ